MTNIFDISRQRKKREHRLECEKIQKVRDMSRSMDELIQDAMVKGVCESCGSFMDNPYHGNPCKLNNNGV